MQVQLYFKVGLFFSGLPVNDLSAGPLSSPMGMKFGKKNGFVFLIQLFFVLMMVDNLFFFDCKMSFWAGSSK